MLDGGLADYIPYVFPAVYMAALVLLHYLVIVGPSRAQLRAQWSTFAARHPERKDERFGAKRLSRPLPNQGDILAGWRALHALEVDAVADLKTPELRAQLMARAAELTDETSAPLREAAVGAAKALRAGSDDPGDALADGRATLKQALTVVYDSRDSAYEEAAEVYRKTQWLALIGAVAIVALGSSIDQGQIFFLVGAVGGLMSRLTRILSRRPRANDYGASWSTLILAPIAGGLAGWLGVALTEALASEDFGLLDAGTFRDIFSGSDGLEGADATVALAVSFIFGFSERLITRATTAAEERVVPKLPTS